MAKNDIVIIDHIIKERIDQNNPCKKKGGSFYYFFKKKKKTKYIFFL